MAVGIYCSHFKKPEKIAQYIAPQGRQIYCPWKYNCESGAFSRKKASI